MQVKLRPSQVNLRDFHMASLKLQRNPGPRAITGTEVALALQSLALLMLKDDALAASQRAVVLLTDRMHRPEDFETYLKVMKEQRSATIQPHSLPAC